MLICIDSICTHTGRFCLTRYSMDHVQAACDTGNLFGMHRLLISWLLYRTSLHWHTSSTKENIAGVNVSSVTESQQAQGPKTPRPIRKRGYGVGTELVRTEYARIRSTLSGLLGTDYYSLFQLLISLHILSVTQELSPVWRFSCQNHTE